MMDYLMNRHFVKLIWEVLHSTSAKTIFKLVLLGLWIDWDVMKISIWFFFDTGNFIQAW